MFGREWESGLLRKHEERINDQVRKLNDREGRIRESYRNRKRRASPGDARLFDVWLPQTNGDAESAHGSGGFFDRIVVLEYRTKESGQQEEVLDPLFHPGKFDVAICLFHGREGTDECADA